MTRSRRCTLGAERTRLGDPLRSFAKVDRSGVLRAERDDGARGAVDVTDRKILDILQRDASTTVAEIGRSVGLSATPCWKRIQNLAAEGIIRKRVALLARDK